MTDGLPSIAQAEALLQEGWKINPGPWADHCRMVGRAARIIAEHCPGMDPQRAQVLGMLHDIGRRFGPMDMNHVVLGYRFALEHGMPGVARISLTHSFAIQDVQCAAGNWDCPAADVDMVREYLAAIEYDDYDRLIQLADYLGIAGGFTTLEPRMVDVTLRRGFNAWTLEKWRAAYRLLDYFEDRMGQPLYPLLPGLAERVLRRGR